MFAKFACLKQTDKPRLICIQVLSIKDHLHLVLLNTLPLIKVQGWPFLSICNCSQCQICSFWWHVKCRLWGPFGWVFFLLIVHFPLPIYLSHFAALHAPMGPFLAYPLFDFSLTKPALGGMFFLLLILSQTQK